MAFQKMWVRSTSAQLIDRLAKHTGKSRAALVDEWARFEARYQGFELPPTEPIGPNPNESSGLAPSGEEPAL